MDHNDVARRTVRDLAAEGLPDTGGPEGLPDTGVLQGRRVPARSVPGRELPARALTPRLLGGYGEPVVELLGVRRLVRSLPGRTLTRLCEGGR